ncbi:ATP phosphoribosyltransferase regulatory subunit [Prochlorococcus sp. MIT 1341]|uniref:ATP phosphoribosyltransferase regulatory subunit n=1 Tax=Prochlorococcus sp. MIT 1341 TaxID=3096221 RepID=UPI002A75839E|nr:ATP phosphoribosyltransferase regulatory subunit [Prochlorococcus sp. MIT 1341]
MALQPAAGAKDLIPQQVEKNQEITTLLAEVYRLWGYEEVSPPRIERLDTLTAGGGISSEEIVKLVAEVPLGLRPEMTASIARAACTRLSNRPRPLRLWATGTIFQSKVGAEGGLCIEENLQSGVELFGVKHIEAELELISLLIESLSTLKINAHHKTTLLIGHTGLMELILNPYRGKLKEEIKNYLIDFDRVGLEQLNLHSAHQEKLIKIIQTRGTANNVLTRLKDIFGEEPIIKDLLRLFKQMEPISKLQGIELQLDPTFQPHFELYNGLVFQLICQGKSSPVVIARGGRYDALVANCGGNKEEAAGVGFSFAIDAIREQITSSKQNQVNNSRTLIAYGPRKSLEDALIQQRELHGKGITAVLELERCPDLDSAQKLLLLRGCKNLNWLNG